MSLAILQFILAANIQTTVIRYRWDDWNVEQAEEPIDEAFLARLKGLSQRASSAFTAATAEWIVHRFGTLCDDPLPLQHLEAAWANVIHNRYQAVTWEEYVDEAQWAGPIKGPLRIAMTWTMYALQQMEEDGEPELGGARITNLAQYVMTDPSPYQAWREGVLRRLESLYPRNPNESLGEAVPRVALDLGLDFTIDQTESSVNLFLAGLDYRFNPFLNPPETMLAEGFEGVPYVFDIEEDRKSRFEW